MASPQKENGFTAIANEILEQVYKSKLNATQIKIILVVWRYTYGFQRKSSDFAEKFVANATGVHKIQLSKELKRLIEMKILIVTKAPTFNTSRELQFNKDYSSWECLQLVNTLGVSEYVNPTVSEYVNPTVSEYVNPTVSENTNQERKRLKKTIKKDVHPFFEKLWELYPNKKGKAQISAKAKREIDKLGYDVMAECIKRYIADKPDWQQYQNGSTFFNSGYLDYLDSNYNSGLNSTATSKVEDTPEVIALRERLRK